MSSQIFLYVGTFIGERLLYMPSLGFCLLLAEPLASSCGSFSVLDADDDVTAASSIGTSDTTRSALRSSEQLVQAHRTSVHQPAGRLLSLALMVAYGVRTWLRNYDWASEETLFRSALTVCPDSAKVRLNNGILARRYQDWEGAIAHFRRAAAIEPGYCEPTYWFGLTRVRPAAICARAGAHAR
jgi:hypothetical protein